MAPTGNWTRRRRSLTLAGLASAVLLFGLLLGGPSAETQGPAPTASIGGPSALRLGEPARFIAAVDPDATRHEWDMDGDGTYERSTAADPVVDHNFSTPGSFTIGLRASFPDGRIATATRTVDVARPSFVGVGFSPANPTPGKRVRFRIGHVAEESNPFHLFSWRFRGLKPLDSRIRLAPAARTAQRGLAPADRLRTSRPPVLGLNGAQPTENPALKRSLPKGVHPIDVKAVDELGGVAEVHTAVGVGKGGPYGGPTSKNFIDTQVKDCLDGGFSGPCAAISIGGQPAVGVTTNFSDVTYDLEVCVPRNATVFERPNLAKLQAALDLPYPSPEQFGAGISQRVQNDCKTYPSKPRSWNLGDGTQMGSSTSVGQVPDVVPHVYDQKGTYQVSLVASVPYVAPEKAQATQNDPHSWYVVKYFLSRITIEIEVIEPVCRTLVLKTIPVSTMLEEGASDTQGAKGCFIPRDGLDGQGTVYEPFPGFDVDLNTIRVRGEVVVDEAGGSIVSTNPNEYFGLDYTGRGPRALWKATTS